jgi:hypothetical protein
MPNEKIEPRKGVEAIYVESFACRVLNNMHYVEIVSGDKQFKFVCQLGGTKALGRALIKQVEEIEKKQGVTYDSRLSDEPMPSPLKRDDLNDK